MDYLTNPKPDEPVLSLIKGAFLSVIFAFTLLLNVGLLMGLGGNRVPALDGQVFQQQWDKVTGGEAPAPWNELEKNE